MKPGSFMHCFHKHKSDNAQNSTQLTILRSAHVEATIMFDYERVWQQSAWWLSSWAVMPVLLVCVKMKCLIGMKYCPNARAGSTYDYEKYDA